MVHVITVYYSNDALKKLLSVSFIIEKHVNGGGVTKKCRGFSAQY